MTNKNLKVIGIIPARYASTRLPGKVLADVNGKPLIQHVWQAVKTSELISRIIIATDDERVAEACNNFGAEYLITPSDLPSGTDRIVYSMNKLQLESDFVINIQGDEPLISGKLIDELIIETAKSKADVGTVIRRIDNYKELLSDSVVKVVLDDVSNAIYFSRSPIPFLRDEKKEDWINKFDYWKHIGLYNYSYQSLMKFSKLPVSSLEKIEKLEQLRLLQSGVKYFCLKTDLELIGIDTPEDLKKDREYICCI